MQTRVHTATVADYDRVAELLAAAFADDPILGWILGERAGRADCRELLLAQGLRTFGRDGAVEVTSDGSAAAAWAGPDRRAPWAPSQWFAGVQGFLQMVRATGLLEIGRPLRLFAATEREHPREPHWYLASIGTLPDRRGSGAASALLTERLAACDRQGVAAYLESSNEANLPLYRRFGFEVTKELRVDDSPPIWPMLRPGRRSASP